MNERLIEEANRLRREINSVSRFILFDAGYSDTPHESRALLGRQLVLMQETLKTMDERIAFVRKQERSAAEQKKEIESKESGRAPDVFTQVRDLINAGAVHRSGLKMDEVSLAQIREHLAFEMVELTQVMQVTYVDRSSAAEEACDIFGVLVHLLIALGMSEQDVANQCAAKFAKRFTIPK